MPLDKDKFDDVSAYARHLRGLDEEEKRRQAQQVNENTDGDSVATVLLDTVSSGVGSGALDLVAGAVEVVADAAGAVADVAGAVVGGIADIF